jgi:putative ABC transport system permease protein
MHPVDAITIAVGSVKTNRLRSMLTMLGIVIGVAAVIIMVSMGAGAREKVAAQISSMGSNLIIVVPGASKSRGAHMGSGTVHTLTAGDARAISRECTAVAAAAPKWGQVTQVVYGNKNWRTNVSGTTGEYFTVRDWQIRVGRGFSDREERIGAKVCIVGSTVAEKLVGDQYPLGKIIRIRNVPFKIIGILADKGQSAGGSDQDDALFVTLAAAHRRLFGTPFKDEVRVILVEARDASLIEKAEKQISRLLMRRHKIGATRQNDFTVRNLSEMLEKRQKSLEVLSILMGAIAAVSLVVGGIGVMNIMLVSVTERTREIGIRMAVGARGSAILWQFLMEAMVLSLAGGIMGVLTGIAGTSLTAAISGWPALVSPVAVVLALFVSGSVGLFFGYWPAFKASRMNPIEALRHE